MFGFKWESRKKPDKLSDFEKRLRDFKLKFFGTNDIILHYREIRKRLGCFNMLMDKNKNEEFMRALTELFTTTEFNIVVSIIDKAEHINCYGKVADDPYELSLNFIIERFIFFIDGDVKSTKIIAEKRGDKEDKKLLESWVKIYQRGTGYIESKELQVKIQELKLNKKGENLAGLQMADIVASCILRKVIKQDQDEECFNVVKDKIIFYKQRCWGRGVKVFPPSSTYKKTISSLV